MYLFGLPVELGAECNNYEHLFLFSILPVLKTEKSYTYIGTSMWSPLASLRFPDVSVWMWSQKNEKRKKLVTKLFDV